MRTAFYLYLIFLLGGCARVIILTPDYPECYRPFDRYNHSTPYSHYTPDVDPALLKAIEEAEPEAD